MFGLIMKGVESPRSLAEAAASRSLVQYLVKHVVRRSVLHSTIFMREWENASAEFLLYLRSYSIHYPDYDRHKHGGDHTCK
jgi:hypothetical protein